MHLRITIGFSPAKQMKNQDDYYVLFLMKKNTDRKGKDYHEEFSKFSFNSPYFQSIFRDYPQKYDFAGVDFREYPKNRK